MEKIREKILRVKFSKFWKRFLVLSLVLVLLGGIGVGISFRTQISEGIAYMGQVRQEEKFCSACGRAVEEAKGGENV